MAHHSISSGIQKNRPFTVAVEGNIGCGKTSFLDYFNRYNNVCVYTEPVNKWQNCNGNNLLALMYEDPKKWAFSFQSYVQLTMLQQHLQPTKKPIKIMERSLYSTKYCFVEKMLSDGVMPAPSASVINEWFKWIVASMDVSVDLIVYLRSSPEVVLERMKERNRIEEKSVSLEYLQQIHEVHENWLYHKTTHSCPAPVLVFDADIDKSVITEEYEKFGPCILRQASLIEA